MPFTHANRLFAAALVAGAILSGPVQAQSTAISQYKLQVDSTLVLGETTQSGLLRVLNNGPADAEVRWFDPQAGAWNTQALEAGESLLSVLGHNVRVSENTLVCLIGKTASSKDKAGYRGTTGFYSLPLVPTPEKDGVETKPTKGSEAKRKPASKEKPDTKDKPGSKEKPDSKEKPGSKEKPDSKEKPGSKEKPDSKDKPGSKEKPDSKEKPGSKEKPDSKEKPGSKEKPDSKDKPGSKEKPDSKDKPEEETKKK